MSRYVDLDKIEFLKVDGNDEFNHGVDCCINRLCKAVLEPCDDVISRRDAMKMFTYNYKGERIPDYDCDNFPVRIDMKTVKKMLGELPSVNPQESKAGHWIDTGSGQQCSECGEIQYGYDNYRRYCAYCGAKMESEASE